MRKEIDTSSFCIPVLVPTCRNTQQVTKQKQQGTVKARQKLGRYLSSITNLTLDAVTAPLQCHPQRLQKISKLQKLCTQYR